MKSSARAKVVLIVSPGHSGSTLLDLLIGSIPGTFSAGECLYLPWQLSRKGRSDSAAVRRQDICSCLKGFNECDVWRKIIVNLSEKVGFDIYKHPFKFPLSMFRSQEYKRKMNFLEKALQIGYSQTMYFPLFRGLNKAFAFIVRNISINNWLLFDTITEEQNTPYIIDSSKDLVRMHLLNRMRPKNVFVVVLVRDIRGVVGSALKLNEDPILTAQQWQGYYRNVYKTIRNNVQIPLTLVRYEDMCKNPASVRRALARFLKLPDPGADFVINTNRNHLVAGNPMRYRGEIKIRKDETWMNVLPQNIAQRLEEIMNSERELFSLIEARSQHD